MSPSEAADDPLVCHLNTVATSFRKGWVTPLLGAGVNLSIRPDGYKWTPPTTDGPAYLPSGGELAGHLAKKFTYPPTSDLMLVSQSAEIDLGPIPLILELSELFYKTYPIAHTHRFLARIPKILAAERPEVRHQLIMSTNYDNLMELAFDEAGQDYDLIWYQAEGNARGTFVHKAPGQDPVPVPPTYAYPFFQLRPVILKLHGSVVNCTQGSYVITEDHYIRYTARIDHHALPRTIVARWINFLYLGYSMRDFNLRVIVRRLQESDGMARVSWAVLRNPTAKETAYWQTNNVALISLDLAQYVEKLEAILVHPPEGGGCPR
jgi:hypothetical protein